MAGVTFAVEGDGVGFATESYAASALYTTLASLSGALWRIRRARPVPRLGGASPCQGQTAPRRGGRPLCPADGAEEHKGGACARSNPPDRRLGHTAMAW